MDKKYKLGIGAIIVIIIFAMFMFLKNLNNVNNISSVQQKKLTKADMVDYWVDNLDECKNEMKKYGYECELVSEKMAGEQVSFLQIETDDKTKIKFKVDSRSRTGYIVKALSGKDYGMEVIVFLNGSIPNNVEADVSTNGGSSCGYENANDFNTPKQQGLKNAIELDGHIKAFISTEELNELRDKTYSVYDDLMEVYKEKVDIDTK